MKHYLTPMMFMAFPYYCSSGKIKDLLLEGVVDDMTRLVLVNAIYFKGKWNREFKEEFTVDALFRLNKVTLYRKSSILGTCDSRPLQSCVYSAGWKSIA